MSQNKFMHPRNIYRKPPSFKDMAIEYPEFRKFAKPDLSGKITLDFKDPEALRALTTTLLLKDFGLHVNIPLTRLIPTLPLRLNYLLWIEDLLDGIGIPTSEYMSVNGIDIGTGASCIYPLLAAKQNSWHMIATEVDSESCRIANENVNDNNLQHLVTVRLVNGDKLLVDVVENDINYTFSMCNPPFFSSQEELDFTSKSRSPRRPPPNNGTTGHVKELIAPGGEVAFILKMMEESKEIGTKIKIYTSMIGHKSSLAILKLQLNKLKVASMAETRFCQGKTTRWGLAWTYLTNISLHKAFQTPCHKKSTTPMTYIVPQEVVSDETLYTVETICERVMDLFSELQIQHKLKKKNNFMNMLDVRAIENTWSHQRRKKRKCTLQEQQCEEEQEEKRNLNKGEAHLKKQGKGKTRISDEPLMIKKRVFSDVEQDEGTSKKLKSDNNMNIFNPKENCESSEEKNTVEPDSAVQEYTTTTTTTTTDTHEVCLEQNDNATILENISELCSPVPLLEATVFVRNIASDVHIEFLWKGGSGGRESMHQVLQYIKNRLK